MMKVTENWENWFMTNLQICVRSVVQTLPVPIWTAAWRQAALPVRTGKTQANASIWGKGKCPAYSHIHNTGKDQTSSRPSLGLPFALQS